jgi:colicin import membrane protein
MVMRANVHRKVEPSADAADAPIRIRRRRRALLGGLLLAIAALGITIPLRELLLDTSAAVPDPSVPNRAPGLLLVQGEPPGSEQRAQADRQAQFDALDQVLEDTRAKLEELTEATATMAADTDVLAGQIRLNEQLDMSLARADAARKAAVAEVEKTRAEMARKLGAATDAAAQSRADLAGLHKELEANDNELAAAKRAREEAERARQAMSNQAASLRTEAARARDELSAAKTEIARLKTANAELEKELTSWRTFWTSAIETARPNPIMLEEKIAEVNAALDLAPPEEATPAASTPTMPVPPEKKPLPPPE